jgi:hypothetical protein
MMSHMRHLFLTTACAAIVCGTSLSALQITSSAFPPNGAIPSKFTCDGQSVTPPLAFSLNANVAADGFASLLPM